MTNNTLISVDATTVIIDPNVRDSAVVTPEFLANIKEHGVIVPTIGYTDEAGVVHIKAGQRRTLAAREAGVPLPVVLRTAGTTAERISEQIVENDQRQNLTTHQRVIAYAQLALEGVSVTKIAKALSVPKKEVEAAITVAKASETLEALREGGDVDLVRLAAITEFEADPQWHESLMETAIHEPDRFENVLEQAAQDKRRAALVAARIAELQAEGKTAITERELEQLDVPHARTRDVQKAKDAEATEAGEPEVRTVVFIRFWQAEPQEYEVMLNPAAYGYTAASNSTSNSGPMTDEQKAERKRLIRRNKEWDASEAVRVRWLTEFLQRKQFPKDAAGFIAISLARFSRYLGEQDDRLAFELLGIEHTYPGNRIVERVLEQPNKAGQVTLALILGQFETGTSRNTWRSPDEKGKHYLQQLEAWGYPLSPVERIGAGYEVADDEFAAEAPVSDEEVEDDEAA